MNLDAVINAYRRYAGIYDLLFGPIMHHGRKRIVEALAGQPGDRILEVGVGTGLSLPLYPKGVHVTGIDVSREMLEKARQRVAQRQLSQVEDIRLMDAERMDFKDGFFDKVVAMYVVSVAPNPTRVVEEMRRVCKPGGEILIVNHFRSQNPVLALFERLLAPLSKLAGFRPDMALDRFIEETGLEVVSVRGANLFGYWKVLQCRNGHEAPAPAMEEAVEAAQGAR